MRVSGVLFAVPALWLAAVVAPAAQPTVQELVAAGYDDFYNLDYEPAMQKFAAAIALDPTDPYLYNHLAQGFLFRELYRNGALESEMVSGNNSFIRRPKLEPPPDVERGFTSNLEKSMQLCQQKLAKNPRDTVTMHVLAAAYVMRANWGYLVRKSWMQSLSDASKARKLDNEVTNLDPSNYDARTLQGLYDYLVGSLSWAYRTVGAVAGFHGDKQRGLKTIEEVTRKGTESRVDAAIMLAALYRRDGEAKKAIPVAQGLIEKFPRNYLIRFELARMYASTGQRREAIETVTDIARRKKEGMPGYERITWEKIYFETGNLHFWFDDFDQALDNLKRVTATTEQLKELDLNTGALALMRQGQIYDLRNRHDLAIGAYQRAIDFAPQAEAAKESQRYLKAPYRRS